MRVVFNEVIKYNLKTLTHVYFAEHQSGLYYRVVLQPSIIFLNPQS